MSLHQYTAYNLGIFSSLLLPELTPLPQEKSDVLVQTKRIIPKSLRRDFNLERNYSISTTSAYLHFTQVGSFFVCKGKELMVVPLPRVEERLVRLPLLGAAFAVLLYQRGNFVLHSSAVEINGGAVCFLGNKGDGKSTMASLLCRRGHQLLSDDTVAIDFPNQGVPVVLPGFPQIKLYPDAITATSDDDPIDLPEIASNVNKRSRSEENFSNLARPLRAIYILREGPEISIELLPPQQAIPFMISNSYMARFSRDWMENGIAAANLRHCTSIVMGTPVYLLRRPRDLSSLEKVAIAVEENSIEEGF